MVGIESYSIDHGLMIAIASTNQDFYQNCADFLQQVAAVSTQIDY